MWKGWMRPVAFGIPRSSTWKGWRTVATGSSDKKLETSIGPPGVHDQVGPPHPISNLRPYHFYIPPNESRLQKRYRLLREDTQRWNHEFWTRHNQEFSQGRVQHIRQILKEKYPNEPEKTTISSDEMSVFYKEFLDQRWTTHIQYNLEWQKRNFNMIGLAFLVTLEGLVKPNQ